MCKVSTLMKVLMGLLLTSSIVCGAGAAMAMFVDSWHHAAFFGLATLVSAVGAGLALDQHTDALEREIYNHGKK